MSTVQTLYDMLQYRPDIKVEADDLIHIVNNAIRTIAKRLYFLDSSLMIGELSVPIFAKITYTASTIAFVDNTPSADTITDSDSLFVSEGFEKDMGIETDCAANVGPFRISSITAGTMTLATEDAVTTQIAGSDYIITSSADYGFLPDDFWGLVDSPYILTKQEALRALPSLDVKLRYITGDPVYYKIKGRKIHVTPATGSDYTIKGDYFKKPTSLTAVTDTIPYYELFDDLIAEYIERFFRNKQTNVQTAQLQLMLMEGVDLIASKYDKAAPVTTSGINWSNYVS